MAEHQVVSFETTVTTATHATSCRTRTSGVTGRAEHCEVSDELRVARSAGRPSSTALYQANLP